MKLLSWNCKGIARPRAIRSLRKTIRSHQPDGVFLAETLLQSINNLDVVNRLQFPFYVHISLIGRWDGLLFMWKVGLDVEVLNISSNTIALLVYSDPVHHP